MPIRVMAHRVVVIDNYDSFTYNLVQVLRLFVGETLVFRNDAIGVSELAALRPDAIVISPGPKTPEHAGISKDVIRRLDATCPILGVCLGHQCLNEVYGGRTVAAPHPWHGKVSPIRHDGRGMFCGVPQDVSVARYHSLVVDREAIGRELEVSAWTNDGLVMGLRHVHRPVEGVQFHPESFMTEHGQTMLRNFLREVRAERAR